MENKLKIYRGKLIIENIVMAIGAAALLAVHAVLALILFALGSLLGSLPLIGILLRGLCLVVYLAALMVIIVLRIRMMFFAYQGIRFTLPVVGERVSQRMGV